MRCLILSDIHGNLPALEQVIKKEPGIDQYINIGDVVNYGPWSNKCVELIDTLNCINIKGNHEEYFINGECDVENDIVQAFFKKNYQEFSKFEIIGNYKDQVMFNDFLLTHNLNGKEYVFRDTAVEIQKNIIIGHSHQQYHRTNDNYNLVNPGSIGQNRQNIELANYIIWDVEKNIFYLKELLVNPNLLINELEIRKYPKICIDYYKNKIK
jgi:putative phosphoesterase